MRHGFMELLPQEKNTDRFLLHLHPFSLGIGLWWLHLPVGRLLHQQGARCHLLISFTGVNFFGGDIIASKSSIDVTKVEKVLTVPTYLTQPPYVKRVDQFLSF